MKKAFAQILVIALFVCFAASAYALNSYSVEEVLQNRGGIPDGMMIVVHGYVKDIQENSFTLTTSEVGSGTLLVYLDDPESKDVLEVGRLVSARGAFSPEYDGNFYSDGVFYIVIHHQIG